MWKKSVIWGLAAVFLIGNSAIAGDITGSVTTKRAKYLRGTVVYVDVIPGKTFPAPKEHAEMDQQKMVFIPFVLPVLVGTTVNFQNNDNVLHNVFTPSKAAGQFNLGSWGKGETKPYTFDKVGSAVMLCNVHPEMEAYVVVLPTPYFAVVDKDGDFTIKGVPAGEYTVKVWNKNRKLKSEPQQAYVSGNGATEIAFTLKR